MIRDTLLALPGLSLWLEPDPAVEPGHQLICLTGPLAAHLFLLLAHPDTLPIPLDTRHLIRDTYYVPHTTDVDARLLALIDALVAVRLNAPDFVQIHLAGLEPDNPALLNQSISGAARDNNHP